VEQKKTKSFLAKTDIQSAFRIIPVHPNDYELPGFSWDGDIYFDKSLFMDCSTSCRIFQEFSFALKWIAIHTFHYRHIVHIFDDFFIDSSHQDNSNALTSFLNLCQLASIRGPFCKQENNGAISIHGICRQ